MSFLSAYVMQRLAAHWSGMKGHKWGNADVHGDLDCLIRLGLLDQLLAPARM